MQNLNRIIYINSNGSLFVQFRPDKQYKLEEMRTQLERARTTNNVLLYHETLTSGNYIEGYVVKITKTGVCLTNWRIG